MRSALAVAAVLVLALGGSSCSRLQTRPMTAGEVRLVRVETPEVVQEDVSYNLLVTFRSDSTPKIQKACFRWLAVSSSVPSPSLYWYANEVQSDRPSGSQGGRWIADGSRYDSSASFCADVRDVKYEGDLGSFVAPIHPKDLKRHYNRLQVSAEYMHEGGLRESNTISANIMVER